MEVCASCGRRLGAGTFCTNCGQPVGVDPDDWRTGTAERPPVSVPEAPPQPTLPPPAQPPRAARYPLFADDVDVAPGGSGPQPAVPPPTHVAAPAAPDPRAGRPAGHRRRSALPWVVGVLAILVVGLVGAVLVSDGDEGAAGDPGQAADEQTTSGPGPGEPSGGEAEPSHEPPPAQQPPPGGDPVDLARYADVEVPDTAPPNEDVDGNLVRYEAGNLVDGVPETCWRMPGSGAGDEIVFSFQEAVTLTEVGLINGYAKLSGDLDWYQGNRRVLDATWVFDDGTSVGQALDQTRALQMIEIDPITTTTVTLQLQSVSEPGRGRAARNYTAISDVSLVGSTA